MDERELLHLRRALWALLALFALSLVIFGAIMMALLAGGAFGTNGGG